ncbi:MAG TPA: prolyl oligopeptidase family serine peptidase [Tepidisphaeraceae bacterium]|nr:prolyl oligopeptidase family serine peptidase [Tepidisphaeraceae bacterium]
MPVFSRRALIVIAAALAVNGSTCPAWAADATVKDFEVREQKDERGGAPLPYRLFKPANYDPARKYPVVLFLHGAGERGSDNAAQVRHILPLAKEAIQKDNPCFIVAPQCPMDRKAFQVWGSGKSHDPTYNDYEGSASTWKKYTIELGKGAVGAKTRLLLVNQPERRPAGDASGGAPVSSSFRNVRVYEGGEADKSNPPVTIDFAKSKSVAKSGNGKLEVSEDGRGVTLTHGLVIKFPFEYTVTPKSVLEVEFMSASKGSAHAIGLDTDDQVDYRWTQVDWGARTHTMPKEPSTPMRLALAALDQVRKEFSTDEKRVYITGLSMGGYGTWDAIARRPDFFAAAVPICGGADEKTAEAIKGVPIWVFHGGADKVVPTERSRNMVEALKKAGGEVKYTEYPGVGHDSWSKTYADPEVWRWMFGQVRK